MVLRKDIPVLTTHDALVPDSFRPRAASELATHSLLDGVVPVAQKRCRSRVARHRGLRDALVPDSYRPGPQASSATHSLLDGVVPAAQKALSKTGSPDTGASATHWSPTRFVPGPQASSATHSLLDGVVPVAQKALSKTGSIVHRPSASVPFAHTDGSTTHCVRSLFGVVPAAHKSPSKARGAPVCVPTPSMTVSCVPRQEVGKRLKDHLPFLIHPAHIFSDGRPKQVLYEPRGSVS